MWASMTFLPLGVFQQPWPGVSPIRHFEHGEGPGDEDGTKKGGGMESVRFLNVSSSFLTAEVVPEQEKEQSETTGEEQQQQQQPVDPPSQTEEPATPQE